MGEKIKFVNVYLDEQGEAYVNAEDVLNEKPVHNNRRTEEGK